MSINNLLAPNNFEIFAKSVTTTGGGGIQDPAKSLYSGNETNVIDIGDSPNPSSGQVLVALDQNNAEWQDQAVTPNNAVIFSNKTITDPSNNVNASSLFAEGGALAIDVRAASQPTSGQVLTAVDGFNATWQTPAAPPTPSNEGSFQSVGAAAPGTVLTSVDLTGVVFDSLVIECMSTAVINTLNQSNAWISYGTIRRVDANTLALDNASEVTIGGTFAESPPVWQLGGGNIINLVKSGANNSRWGGRWSYADTGPFP